MPMTLTIGGIAATIAIEDLGDKAIVEALPDIAEGPKATVIFRCNYSERYSLLRGLLGSVTTNGFNIVRVAPYAYPPNPYLRCMGVGEITGIKPRRDPTGWITYHFAQFPAYFGVPKYAYEETAPNGQNTNDPSGKPWTTTKFKVSAEVVVPPDGAFYIGPFPSTKKAEEATIGIIRPAIEITMARHFMPFVPLAQVSSVVGSVNADPVAFANHVFPRGHLLFVGMDSDPSVDPTGLPTQDITYTLMGRRTLSWNQFISANGSNQFLNTEKNGTGNPPYSYVDFTTIP